MPIGRSLAQVLFYMGEAIDRAEDKKPRSGNVGSSHVLKLNDEITSGSGGVPSDPRNGSIRI